MSNVYRQLQELLAPGLLQIGTVDSVSSGMATITLVGGGTIIARGSASPGDRVFVQDGVIQGPAPTLSVETIDV